MDEPIYVTKATIDKLFLLYEDMSTVYVSICSPPEAKDEGLIGSPKDSLRTALKV
jgi:hypothetical protein